MKPAEKLNSLGNR